MTIEELSAQSGINLLTAYIMRETKCSASEAEDTVWQIMDTVDAAIDNAMEDEDELTDEDN